MYNAKALQSQEGCCGMVGDSYSPGELSFTLLAYIQLSDLQCLLLLCSNVCKES